jgi:hypothetical protein
MSRLTICALLLSVFVACGGDEQTPDHTTDAGHELKDAGPRTPVTAASPPIAAANQVCATLSECTGAGLYVSMRECVKQRSEHFNEVASACYECLAEVTCAGWRAIDAGTTDECGICPDCCQETADNCTPGTSSVPNSANDPCPQTTPLCPASLNYAVATCGTDGTWQKQADGVIACACLPKDQTTQKPPHSTLCGNGRVDSSEQCDGLDLRGETCDSLQGASGQLRCSKTACTYDASGCFRETDSDGGI